MRINSVFTLVLTFHGFLPLYLVFPDQYSTVVGSVDMTKKTINRLNGLIRNYARDKSGQFAILFSGSSFLILMVTGFAIDHSSVTHTKSKAQNALDASVMAAARIYQLEENQGKARLFGQDVYDEHCANHGCDRSNAPVISIADGGTDGFTVSGQVSGAVDPYILDIVIDKKLTYSVESEVSFGEASGYNDIYFILDWSASLGIAATPAEMQTLKDLTAPYVSGMAAAADGCAFACHFDESFIQPEIGGTVVTTYEFARANGINLREDELADVTEQIIDQIFTEASLTTRVGVYAVSDSLAKVEEVTNIPFDLSTSLNGLALDKHGTRFDTAMPSVTMQIGASGGGTSQNDTKKFAVLVTDGLNNNYSAGIITGPFQSSYCDGLKSNGVEIAVLHLPYPDLNGQAWYEWFAEPHLPATQSALEACASDGLYFQASETNDILGALEAITEGLIEGEAQELAFVK